MFPSLQLLCVATIVENENLLDILNQPKAWEFFFDNDEDYNKYHRQNERLSVAEHQMFVMKCLNGTKLVDVKNEIRVLMESKPFANEDKLILKNLPILCHFPERIVKVFWIEAIAQMFDRYIRGRQVVSSNCWD